jgi:hypothetical protein
MSPPTKAIQIKKYGTLLEEPRKIEAIEAITVDLNG